jgi:hypothetical protein
MRFSDSRLPPGVRRFMLGDFSLEERQIVWEKLLAVGGYGQIVQGLWVSQGSVPVAVKIQVGIISH